MMARKIRIVRIPIGLSSFGRGLSAGVDAISVEEMAVMERLLASPRRVPWGMTGV